MSHKTETKTQAPHIIVIGCGRLGAELARSLGAHQYSVAIVDADLQSFKRLGPDFRGQTVEGEAFDQGVLKRAGIEQAYGFAAVTALDNVNVITCQVARDIYHVPRVVARLYNPSRAALYQKLNLQTVASSSWGAQRVEQIMLNPGVQGVYSLGNGEVHIYEISIPSAWAGKRVSELLPKGEAIATALTRAGIAQLLQGELMLEVQDIVLVSATAAGAAAMQKLLDPAN